jgi:hypothetical protein
LQQHNNGISELRWKAWKLRWKDNNIPKDSSQSEGIERVILGQYLLVKTDRRRTFEQRAISFLGPGNHKLN